MILNIFKIGGSLANDGNQRRAFISNLASLEHPCIVVHGGGKAASEMSRKLGIEVKMLEGRRITNEATLKVVVMTYAGLINKSLVADLQAAGINCIGLTGADANIIEAHKRTGSAIDYGFAGDIDRVNTGILTKLIQDDISPVIAPITHDGKGQLLNTNADTIATALASALADTYTVHLYYIMDRKGVLSDPNDLESVIPELKLNDIDAMRKDGIIVKGMIPKLHNAESALKSGVGSVFLTDVEGMSSMGKSGTSIITE
ncbi:MAG: acetylglutamate kinase [Bacteroidetes bacterium]|nr:acetylglutamate kinase [Bacteroidota bacterium]